VRLGEKIGLSEQEIIDLRRGALLHDIGKICIPDEILNKPGEFTSEEYEVMKKHALFGASILRHIRCLENALVVAESHHEKWDGSGYPHGRCGEEIPLFARISSIAGTYDALTSQRAHRPAFSQNEALHFIGERSGMYYDPKIVNMFLSMMKDEPG
jgi:putative nucleotidyltransferase with HDIG domain